MATTACIVHCDVASGSISLSFGLQTLDMAMYPRGVSMSEKTGPASSLSSPFKRGHVGCSIPFKPPCASKIVQPYLMTQRFDGPVIIIA